MKITNILAAAGLSLTVASFAPPVWAQVGGTSSGMPGAGAGVNGPLQQAPSAGQPGTQAPASAAPIGASTSDWMSSEGRSAAAHSSVLPQAGTANKEKRLRAEETGLERDLVAYRARGYNVQPAVWQKWLGSEALSRGDQKGAAIHFNKAKNDLRRLSEARANTHPNYSSDAQLHGNETSQATSATDMHSNRGSSSVY
jgi:hypothetical protein